MPDVVVRVSAESVWGGSRLWLPGTGSGWDHFGMAELWIPVPPLADEVVPQASWTRAP